MNRWEREDFCRSAFDVVDDDSLRALRAPAEFDPKYQIKLKKLTTEVSMGNCYEIYIYLNSNLTNVSASLNLINSSSVGACKRQLSV